MMENELEFKFLIIGDSGVGKTCLLNRYVEDQYSDKLAPTVGIDIRDKNILYRSNKNNKSYNVHLQLWDTAGQERFRSLTASFFRDAIGFLLVFDLTSESSFLNVRNWIGEIQANAYSEHVDMVLIGNKSDLDSQRIISQQRAMDFARQNQVEYIETSALANQNVAESVELLIEAVMDRLIQTQNLNGNHHRIKRTTFPTPVNKVDENQAPGKSNASKTNCCFYS